MKAIKRKMDDLKELLKQRDGVVERIGELVAYKEGIDGGIAERREELKELNEWIDSTRHEKVKEEEKEAVEFKKTLQSNDGSLMRRSFQKLNKKIDEGRKRHWFTFIENTTYPSEGELRHQRRAVVSKMIEAEAAEEFEE